MRADTETYFKNTHLGGGLHSGKKNTMNRSSEYKYHNSHGLQRVVQIHTQHSILERLHPCVFSCITRGYVPLCSQRIHCLSKQSIKGTISLKSSVILLLLLRTRFMVYSSIVELYSLGAKVHYRTYKNKEICGGLT